MPRLPGPEQLGAVPSMRSGRTTPSVGSLDTGASQIAKGIGKVGDSMAKIGLELQERHDTYEVNKRLIEFTREEQRRLEEERRAMAPGGDGFSEGWNQSYETRARSLFDQARKDGLSQRALESLDLGLARGHEGTFTAAHRYEQEERRRFHKEEVENTLSGLARDAAAAPDRLAELRALGESQIDNSRLDAADKYAVRRAWGRRIEDEVRTALVNGATTAEDFRNARRRLYGDDQPARPQGRDRSGSDFMRPPGTAPSSRPLQPGEERALGGIDRPSAEGLEQPADIFGRPRPGERRSDAGPTLGRISGHYESGGRGVGFISSGRNDPGGQSYGIHQLSGAHSMGAFLRSPEGEAYRAEFGTARPQTAEFNRIYRDIAARDPDGFAAAQHAFYTRTHYEPARQAAEEAGFDVSNPGIQEAIFSMGVQHAKAPDVIRRAGANLPANATVEQQIRALYDARSNYVAQLRDLPEDTRRSVLSRYRSEVRDVIALANGEAVERAGDRPGATRTDAALPPNTYRVGSRQWADAVANAEDRGERPYQGDLVNTTGAQRRATLRALDTRERQLITGLTQEITRWEQGAGNGILPPDAEIAQVQEQVEAFDDPALTQHFNSVIDLAALTRQARTLPPQQLEEMVRLERARQMREGATDVAQKRLRHMETLLQSARTQIEKDPNGWAHTVGLADFSQPPDFNNDTSMAAHAERARAVGRYLNQAPVFFSPNQRAAAMDIARQGGQPMLDMIGSIVRNWGNDSPRAIAEFAKDDPELAFIGGMYLDAVRSGDAGMQAVRDAVRGVELRRDENYKKIMSNILPTRQEMETAATDIVGTAFQASPQTMAAAIGTANLIYSARAAQKGLTAFDQNLWQQGFKEALGEHTANNQIYGGLYHQRRGLFGGNAGNPILVPSNLRQDAVPQLLDSLRSEDLIDPFGEGPSTGPSVSPVTGVTRSATPLSMNVLRRATLVSVGDGRYWMAQGDPQSSEPMWIKTSSGANYVLDLNRLEPILRQRRPDLYLGYVQPVAMPPPLSDQGDMPARTSRSPASEPASPQQEQRPPATPESGARGKAAPEPPEPESGAVGKAAPRESENVDDRRAGQGEFRGRSDDDLLAEYNRIGSRERTEADKQRQRELLDEFERRNLLRLQRPNEPPPARIEPDESGAIVPLPKG